MNPAIEELSAAWRRRAASEGVPVLGAAVSESAAARALEKAGVDFLVACGPGSDGAAGLLPFADANARVLQAAAQFFAEPRGVPVLAGICGTDPLRLMGRFLEEIRRAGYAGLMNWPSVGMIDGSFRAALEEARLGYEREVEAVRGAGAAGLWAAACVFGPDEARAMARAGARVLVVHAGPGNCSAEEFSRRVREVARAAREGRGDALVLAHTEPLRTLRDFTELWTGTGELDGFFGGSLFEGRGRPGAEEVARLRRPPAREL
ncbi:MAG TPA: phosphoenolpyruvate hydrolase family protein [Planctomycetota bacterium]|nr:phosphoenolpyruvate hydrolase family protein [Planctomycetota bacterium]